MLSIAYYPCPAVLYRDKSKYAIVWFKTSIIDFTCLQWHSFVISSVSMCSAINISVSLIRLDGRHVVFGKVLSGMDVVYKVEAEGRQSGTPKSNVVIADSGELPL